METTAENVISSTTFLPTEDRKVITIEEISSSYQTELTTESILDPITMETTAGDLFLSTYFPSEDPKTSTIEQISSSYQTEQLSSYGSKETIAEEISTEPEQTSSSFKTAHFSSTDSINEITSKTVDIISSDSTTETISSSPTKNEIPSIFDYQTTIDPVLVGFVCPEKSGYYPHPINKRKFIGCVHNIACIIDYPSNLVYNHK